MIGQNLGPDVSNAMQLRCLSNFSRNVQPLLPCILQNALNLLLARVLLHCVKQIWQPVYLVEPNSVAAGTGEEECNQTEQR